MKQRTTHIWLILALAAQASAQRGELPLHVERLGVQSGPLAGFSGDDRVAWEYVARSDGAPWLRVRFGEWDLGEASRVRLTSLEDDEVQLMDGADLTRWANTSAFFNGDAILVQVVLAPGDSGVSVELGELVVGERAVGQETICGLTDDRTSTNNNRTGRLVPILCTAWRSVNGAMVTAGHCVDPNANGVHNLTGSCVQFNIPASDPDGTINNPPVADQFPFDSTIAPRFNFDGTSNLGRDWGVFGIGPNSSGELPHERYGLPFRATRELPSTSEDVRVTGCGFDDRPPGTTGGGNSDSSTLQTEVGGFNGESSSGNDFWLRYRVDTQGGNSGSPVLWFQTELLAIGVHTDGGCNVLPGTNNFGTSCEHNPFESALHTWLDTAVEFADEGHPLPGGTGETGQLYRPWDTVPEAVIALPSGGTVAIVAGNYTEGEGNLFTTNKAMTLVAPCGTVVIGE